MNKDATHLVSAKFVHRSADILRALFDNAAEHKTQPEFFGSLLAMHHDLGRTIEAGGKGDESDGGGTFAGQLPGGHVGSETYFGEDLLNPGSSLGGDAGHPVNNPRDGLIRNAG